MGIKVTNNAYGTLSASITSSGTTIALATGQGARFPTLGAGDYFYGTLIDTSNNVEIVKVTARSTDSMTVVRAQDNTTARAYSTNDRFELRPTAALFNDLIDGKLDKAGGTMTGALTVQSGGVTFLTNDANGYARITQSSGSAQLGLFRSGTSVGGGYIGADANNCLDVRDADFTTRFKVDQSGRVMTPYQPAFIANLSADWSHPSGVQKVVGTYSADVNVGSGFSTSTKRYTAPVAGNYFISASVATIGGAGTFAYLSSEIWVNGSRRIVGGWDGGGSSYGNTSVSGVIALNASDYVELYCEANKTFTMTSGPGYSFLSGFLIG